MNSTPRLEARDMRGSNKPSSLCVMAMLICGAWLPWWAAATPSMQPGFNRTVPVTGSDLQIAPLSNGLPAYAGGPARLRILLHGQPAAGAYVWVENAAGRSAKAEVADHEGVVTVQVPHTGLSTVRAVVPSSSADPSRTRTDAAAMGSLSIFLALPTE
jgi:hypothetical protein